MSQIVIKFLGSACMLVLLYGCAGLSEKNTATLRNLEGNASQAMLSVQEKLKSNPDSVLQDSLLVLDEILSYTEQVKVNPKQFDLEQIQAFMHKIKVINENIRRFSDLTLQTDISFPLGTYKLDNLAAIGKQKSDELADNVLASLQELTQQYPQQTVRIIIKTIGYTDETPVLAGSRLEKALIAQLTEGEARSPSVYNKILSKLRATSLNDYVVKRIKNNLPAGAKVDIERKIVGRGEAHPLADVVPAYQRQDSRRRICILSPFIEIIP